LNTSGVFRTLEPFVVKVLEGQLEELRVILLDHDNTREHKKTNKYEAFRFYYAGGSIIAYTSGKVVANSPETSELLRNSVLDLSSEDPEKTIIGSDEAGKGEWLGPLTVAAVALDAKQEVYLRSVGVMDSKELSLRKIGELSYEVEDNSVAIKTLIISPPTFEKRLAEFHGEGKTLNDLLAWAHTEVIRDVYSRVVTAPKNVRIVIDQFDKEKTDQRIGRILGLKGATVTQMPRAETITAVAAASIIARDLREEWIDKKSLQLGVELQGMRPQDAMARKDVKQFAKMSYLQETLKSKRR
jgi:ribonuclease HIII